MTNLAAAFSLADLIGAPLLTQYLGDALDTLATQLLVLPDPSHPGAWQIAYVLDGTPPRVPLVGDALALDLSGLTGSGGATDAVVFASVTIATDPFVVTVTPLPGIKLRVSPDLLKPLDGSDAVKFDFLAGVAIKFSAAGVSFQTPSALTLTLPPCALASTGITLNSGTVALALWGTNGDTTLPALGVDDSFRGVILKNVAFTLPSELTGLDISKLVFPFATFSRKGFSGTIEVDFSTAAAGAEFLGATIAPKTLTVEIGHNSLTGAGLDCALTLPFFDQTVQATIALSDGAWSLGLSGANVQVNGPAFNLTLTGLGIERRDGDTWFKVSGTLIPQVAGFTFPELELKDVLIDQHGHIKASGGKMALSSQKVFELGSILKAKLIQFAFGADSDTQRYVTLSGEVDLIQGLPLKGAFDQLRIGWSTTGGAPTFSLDGVEIAIGVPGVFDFDGKLAFINTTENGLKEVGFSGSIHLGITPAQLSLDGFFKVLEVTAADGTKFTAFGIEVDLNLPAAIPLAQTNLGIYGFNGLVAWNYGPNLTPYNGDWNMWFLGRKSGQPDQVGVTGPNFLTKWGAVQNKKGAGAGLTIGTMADTGFSWHARTTFIILLPGPDLILNGDCNFICKQPGLAENVSGAFQVFIAYDGDAETLNAAISAQVGKDPIFFASGAAWAFFDFNQPSAWYLDVGTKDRPIQATVAKILNGTAYLDLSANVLSAGAQAGYSEKFSAGPLSASVTAHAGFDAVLTRRPLRLTGDAYLQGAVALKAWKFGANVGLNAQIDMNAMVKAGPQPNVAYHFHFNIQAELHAKILFKSIDISETIQIDVTSAADPAAADPPVYPVGAISLELPAHTAETWPLAITHAQAVAGAMTEDNVGNVANPAQGVPLDALPTLVFSVPLRDKNSIGQNPPLDGSVQIGNAAYQYALESIVITGPDGRIAYSSNPTDNAAPVWGKWCEELGPRGKTRLQLWTDTPYFISLRNTPDNRLADAAAIRGPSPCSTSVTDTTGTCISMCDLPRVTLDDGSSFVLDGAADDGFVFHSAGARPWGRLAPKIVIGNTPPACWVVVSAGDSLSLPGQSVMVRLTAVRLQLSGPPPQTLDPLAVTPASAFKITDGAGHVVPFQIQRTAAGADAVFTLKFPPVANARLVFQVPLAVSTVCAFDQHQVILHDQAQAAAQQQQNALQQGASGTQARTPFAPWSNYQLSVTVSVQGPGGSGNFVDTVNFTTGGPPGVLDFDPSASPPPQPNAYPVGGPLVNLDRYVAATVPSSGADDARFDNAYRGYDPAVIFNEGYVLAMYQAASGAALTLDVVEANGDSLRNTASPSVFAASLKRPGRNNPQRQLWGSRLSTQCGITQQYPPDDGLALQLDPRTALRPRRQYRLQVAAGTTSSGTPRLVYATAFSSSRFLSATHHLQSFPDVAFTAALDATADLTVLRQAVMTNPFSGGPVSDSEASLFDQIVSALKLPPAAPRETLDGTALCTADRQCRALLITSPEPLPWDRLQITSATFSAGASKIQRPVRASITHIAVDASNRGYIEVMLLEDGDPSGWTVTLTHPDTAGTGPIRRLVTETFYTFANEGTWPSGTVFRLVNGRAANDSSPDIRERAATLTAFPAAALTVGITANDNVLHRRTFVPDSAFSSFNYRLVRKRDGTAFFLVAAALNRNPATISVGELKLGITVNRNLTSDPSGLRLWARQGVSTPELLTLHLRVPALV